MKKGERLREIQRKTEAFRDHVADYGLIDTESLPHPFRGVGYRLIKEGEANRVEKRIMALLTEIVELTEGNQGEDAQ